MAEREWEWEWECFDIQGNRTDIRCLSSYLFISFRQTVSILIDFSCGEENGFAWNIFYGFELTVSAEEKENYSRTGFCIPIEPCMDFIRGRGKPWKSLGIYSSPGECYLNCPPTQYRKDDFQNEIERWIYYWAFLMNAMF